MSMFRKPKPETPVLVAADQMLRQTRQKDYGNPAANMARIAAVWSAILRHPVTPEQVALMMAGLKVVRAGGRRDVDDLVDLAAYTAIAQDCRNGS